jgi:hypothetical protein
LKEKVCASETKMSGSRKEELNEQNRDEGDDDTREKDLNGERAGKDWTIGEVRVCRVATG